MPHTVPCHLAGLRAAIPKPCVSPCSCSYHYLPSPCATPCTHTSRSAMHPDVPLVSAVPCVPLPCISPCLVHPHAPCVPIPCTSLCPVFPVSSVPCALLTSSTFLKTRSRFSARAIFTSASVQFLASSSATSAGYVETSSRLVGSLCHPTACSCAGGSRAQQHPPPAPPSCPCRAQGRPPHGWGRAALSQQHSPSCAHHLLYLVTPS